MHILYENDEDEREDLMGNGIVRVCVVREMMVVGMCWEGNMGN